MRAALLLALLCAAAQAQHVHDDPKPAKAAPAIDKLDRKVKVLAAPAPGETVEHAALRGLPVGTGAVDASKLGAWLVPPTSGDYLFPQSGTKHGKRVPVLNGCQDFPTPCTLIAGRPYRLNPWKGPLVYTPPGGKQGPVPKEYLLPVNPATMVR